MSNLDVICGKNTIHIRCLKIVNKVQLYVFLDENSNNIFQRLILDDDNILVVVKMTYNGNILHNPRVYDSKYILKKGIFIILRFPSGAVFVN